MSGYITELSRDRIKESENEENDRKLYIKVIEVALGSSVSCLENSTGSLYEPAWYREQVPEQIPKAKQRNLAYFF